MTPGRELRRRLRDDGVVILPPADVLATLRRLRRLRVNAACCVLDPWYNRGTGGTRRDYIPWLLRVVRAAARVASHVFLWGFPETLALVVPRVPTSLRLRAWLTWHYTNAPTRAWGWRPAQQACLHLARPHARLHAENFFSEEQAARSKAGRLRYPPSPSSVISVPLIVGWAGRSEATGHPSQKPERVIDPLVRMSTRPGDLVIDPMAGSGTSAAVALRLGRRALVADASEEFTSMIETRVGRVRVGAVKPPSRKRVGALTPRELEARRRRAVEMIARGGTQAEVARALGVSREAVRQWVQAGADLRVRPRRGRVPKLTARQERRLARMLAAGQVSGSAGEIARAIEGKFGVRYHRSAIKALLHRVERG